MRVVARGIFVAIVGTAGEKRILDFPDSRLGANGELEVFALETPMRTLNHTQVVTRRRTVILSQYL